MIFLFCSQSAVLAQLDEWATFEISMIREAADTRPKAWIRGKLGSYGWKVWMRRILCCSIRSRDGKVD